MRDKYEWNRDFRARIMALCLDPEWYAKYGTSLVRPEYFETDIEIATTSSIIDFYKKYDRMPDDDELVSILEGLDLDSDDIAGTVTNLYYLAEEGDLDFAADQAVQFAKEQAMKIAILDSVKDIQKGVLSKPLERVAQAQMVGTNLKDLGLDLKTNKQWMLEESEGDKIHTGIYHLDMMLEGGLGRGELGIVMAATNVGKTMALVNIGCGAAGLLERRNVVHITLELNEKKVAKRYAARTVFRWILREDNPDEYLIAFEDAIKHRLPGRIRIKSWPPGVATAADIEAYLDRLKILGEPCDVLIVDYPDEMKMKDGEYRFVIADVFRELRAIGVKWNVVVWAATQAGRQALSKELVTLGDIAESYQKATVSDVILAMCQTQSEQEEGLMRFYAAKVRDGDKGWMVKCHIDPDSHAIISEKVMSVSELKEAKKREEG